MKQLEHIHGIKLGSDLKTESLGSLPSCQGTQQETQGKSLLSHSEEHLEVQRKRASTNMITKPTSTLSPGTINKRASAEYLPFSLDSQNHIVFSSPLRDWKVSQLNVLEKQALEKRLTYFSFESQADNIKDEDIESLAKACPAAEVLNLQNCIHITDASLQAIGTLSNLTWISLRNCENITDTGLAHLSQLKKIETLDLSGCHQTTTEAAYGLVKTIENLHWVCLPDGSHLQEGSLRALRKSLTPQGFEPKNTPQVSTTTDAVDDAVEDPDITEIEDAIQTYDSQYIKALKISTEKTQRITNQIDKGDVAHAPQELNVMDIGYSLSKVIKNKEDVLENKEKWLDVQCVNFTNSDGLVLCTKDIEALVRLFPNLIALEFKNRKDLTDACLKPLEKLKFLRSLILKSCPRITDKGIGFVSNCKELINLTLYNCKGVSNKAATSLSKLKSLKSLNIKGSMQIDNFDLDYLSHLHQMEYLIIDVNYENGIPDIEYLERMKNLRGLAFMGEWSRSDEEEHKWAYAVLDRLPSLNFLEVSSCVFSLDDTLRQDGHHRHRDFSKLKIDRRISFFKPSKKFYGRKDITILSLRELPTRMKEAHLEKLREIGPKVEGIRISSKIAKIISDNDMFRILHACPNLTVLDLSKCSKITEFTLSFLHNQYTANILKNLEILSLRSCANITDTGLGSISAIETIKKLNLRDCKKITNQGILAISTMHALNYLNIADNPVIEDRSLQHIAKLHKLEALDVQGCSLLTQQGMAYLIASRKLKKLHLNGCEKVRPESIVSLAICLENMEELSFRCEKYNSKDIFEIATNSEKWTERVNTNTPVSEKVRQENYQKYRNGMKTGAKRVISYLLQGLGHFADRNFVEGSASFKKAADRVWGMYEEHTQRHVQLGSH